MQQQTTPGTNNIMREIGECYTVSYKMLTPKRNNTLQSNESLSIVQLVNVDRSFFYIFMVPSFRYEVQHKIHLKKHKTQKLKLNQINHYSCNEVGIIRMDKIGLNMVFECLLKKVANTSDIKYNNIAAFFSDLTTKRFRRKIRTAT